MKLAAHILGLALALSATVAACGAAATLALGSNKLSAGNAAVSSCGVSSLSATRKASNAGTVTEVDVPSIPSACAGATLSLTLVGPGGAALGNANATVPAGGGTLVFTSFGATVLATNLLSYSFAVVGP